MQACMKAFMTASLVLSIIMQEYLLINHFLIGLHLYSSYGVC